MLNRRFLISKINLINSELEKRNKLYPIDLYNKGKQIHEKQQEFHKCLKKNRWVFGGNRTGKTECGAVEVVYLARGNHPYRQIKSATQGWVVSLSRQVQRDVAQKKILYYLRPEWVVDVVMSEGKKSNFEGGMIDYIVIKNIFGTNSVIGFKSCDQGREKFQGASLDYVWFDEEPPYDIYMESRMRVLDNCGEVFGTMTPLKGLTWVYDEIFLNQNNDDEVWQTSMQWEDNPFLDKAEIERISSAISQEELQSRKFGKFMFSGGAVYNEFDENLHVIEPFNVPVEWYDQISVDPGLNNPLSAHWFAVDYDGNVFVIAEHYQAKKDVEYHANKIKEISKNLMWHLGFNGKLEILIDSAANQRTLASSKSVTELFYDHGINANPKVNKDLFSGISRVKTYLKDANEKTSLFIFKNCVNLIREFKGYYWGNGDAPIKRDDHALDALRYYIMSKPQKATIGQGQKTEIQKHKEKLIRQSKFKH